ncbi:RNA-binding protein [Candidatus Woesearchaeota archaeon]|nr:RNA-binding protein [Candidatus Woesearchaeota archaeon]
MENLICNSCKVEISNQPGSTIFKCPKCSKSEIVRCYHCRQIASKYKCNECGFEGPN